MNTIKRDRRGTMCWYDEAGRYHRENDLPAKEYSNGDREWYRHGELHRDNDLPAVVLVMEEFKSWWNDGVLTRFGDKPAVEISDGTKEWWLEGECYRFDIWVVL